MKRCSVKTRHVPGSRAERECEMHGVGAHPRSATATVPPPVAAREPEVKVERLEDGTPLETWHLDGKLHREDGPARVWYRPDGRVERESWWLDGKSHRVDGPALVDYRPDGTVEQEWWWVNDKPHRVDGPAYVAYHPDGTVWREQWYLEGERHRVDGPAVAECRADGTVEDEVWWLDGRKVLRERVAAAYLAEHFGPVSETNTGAIDMLLAQGPLTSLTAEQVRLALTLYPEL